MFIDPIGCLRILIVLNHFNAKHNMNDASSKIDCFQSYCCVISIFTANCSSDFFDKREWKKKAIALVIKVCEEWKVWRFCFYNASICCAGFLGVKKVSKVCVILFTM